MLGHIELYPELSAVDTDLSAMLRAWFNGGLLEMRRVTWTSSAQLLDRIMRHEAVHTMQGWDDLRSRLDPTDRRCFAFFHPGMPDNPLIFVEVAPHSGHVGQHFRDSRPCATAPRPGRGALRRIFSISNCQKGLQGIPFGNLLLRRVATELSHDLPQLRHFVTLSPAGFAARCPILPRSEAAKRKSTRSGGRFHLGNGARLERINWLADRSDYGQRQSGGIMVNYVYDLTKVEEHN
jgi:malonyl-CoA decarboxylase